MKITVTDRLSYVTPTQREYTPEGFLRVPGYVAKVGTQDYAAGELGLPGDPLRRVTVYRPAEEVFKPESLALYDGIDLTLNHPDGFVNPSNYKNTSKGVIRGKGEVDGEHVKCELIVKDAQLIHSVESGKVELSVGYTAEYEEHAGVTADGVKYEWIQRNITPNHVAFVDRARAGRTARIFDNQPREDIMKHTITIDGVPVDAAVAENAPTTVAYINKITQDRDTLQAKYDAQNEQIVALQLKTSDSHMLDQAKMIAKVTNDAQFLVGEDKVVEIDAPITMMKAAMADRDFAGKSDEYIKAMFDMQVEQKRATAKTLSAVSQDAASEPVATVTTDSSRSAYVNRLSNGWSNQ